MESEHQEKQAILQIMQLRLAVNSLLAFTGSGIFTICHIVLGSFLTQAASKKMGGLFWVLLFIVLLFGLYLVISTYLVKMLNLGFYYLWPLIKLGIVKSVNFKDLERFEKLGFN